MEVKNEIKKYSISIFVEDKVAITVEFLALNAYITEEKKS